MATIRGKMGLRWALTAAVVMLLGALIGLSISLMRSPSPPLRDKVVKSLPPSPPPEKPSFMGAEEEGMEAIQRAQDEALKMMTEGELQEEDLEESPRLRMPEVVPPISEYPEAVELPAPEQEVQEVAEADREAVPVSEPVSLPTEPELLEPPSAPGDEVSPPKQAALAEEPETPPPPPAEKGPPAAEPAPFAYTIHLESFRNSMVAEKRLKHIEGMGLEAFTVEVDLPEKGIFHRIFVGRFADRSQAKALQARLKKDYGLPEGRIMAASKIDR